MADADGAQDAAVCRHQAMVRAFHEAFDLPRRQAPGEVDPQTRDLRLVLILEELTELAEAAGAEPAVLAALEGAVRAARGGQGCGRPADLVGVADALADLLYVVYGAAVSYGIQLGPIFAEVHRSNMAKVGGWRRADGKWMKPGGWQPPRIAPLLQAQGWRPPSVPPREAGPSGP